MFHQKKVGRWSNSPYMLFFFPWNQNGLKLQTRSVVVRSQNTVNMTLCEWCGWDEFCILVYIVNCKLGLSFWACFARHSFPGSLVWGYLSRGSTNFALWKCYETATDSCVCWQLRTSSSAGAMTTPWPRNRLYAPQVLQSSGVLEITQPSSGWGKRGKSGHNRIAGHFSSYLEDHTRTCKWLVSPPCTNHGKAIWKRNNPWLIHHGY